MQKEQKIHLHDYWFYFSDGVFNGFAHHKDRMLGEFLLFFKHNPATTFGTIEFSCINYPVLNRGPIIARNVNEGRRLILQYFEEIKDVKKHISATIRYYKTDPQKNNLICDGIEDLLKREYESPNEENVVWWAQSEEAFFAFRDEIKKSKKKGSYI